MKNKSKIVVGMTLVVFMMTIVYAAFSTNLIISGTANIASEWKVVFTKIEQVSKTSGVNIKSTPVASGTTATFDVGLTSPGDNIVYEITVENQGTLNAIIESIAANETGSDAVIFEISNIKTGDILNAKKTTTFNIKIMYDPNVTSQPVDLTNKLTIGVGYTQYIGQTILNNAPTINNSVLTNLSGSTSLTLSNSAGRALNNYVISGNTVQNGNPSPDTPAAIQSAGIKTDNLYYKSGTISTSNLGLTVSYDEKTQTYTLNGTTTGVGNIDLSVKMDIPLAEGETFYYTRVIDGGSVEFPSGAYLLYSIFNQENATYIGNRIREDSATLGNNFITNQNTLPAKGSSGLYRAYIQCLGVKGIVFNNFKIKFMISKTSPQEYEPYGYKLPISVSNGTLTNNYNIYLDEPLRCIDGSCDYIDFKNKKISRIVKEIICDGTEDWQRIGSEGSSNRYYGVEVGEEGSIVAGKGLSTHYVRNTITASTTVIGFNPSNSSSYNQARISVRPDSTINSISKWKEYLAAQYANGTPFVVDYVLVAEDQDTIDLPTIYTLEGNNTLSITSNNGVSIPIEVDYYKMP